MEVNLRYLGYSGFEIKTDSGYQLVIDPLLVGSKKHGIPPSPIPIEELKHTSLVMVTHGAFDHLGQALEIVQKFGCRLLCSTDVQIHALSQDIPEKLIVPMLSGCTYHLEGLFIKAFDVRHVSLFQSKDVWLSGQPLSFIINLPHGPTIYHSGDTSLFGDLKLIGMLHKPDVALLCVGGINFNGYELVPLPPNEASIAYQWLGAKLAIPMHYTPNSNAPEEFESIVTSAQMGCVHIMKPGEVVNLDQLLAEC